QDLPDSIVVPPAAILTSADGTTSVMVVGPDSHAHLHAVKIGLRQDDYVQVCEGLEAGQKVVGSGAYGLPDNAKVTAEEKPETSSSGESKPAAGRGGSDDK